MAGRTLAITYTGDARAALAAQSQIDAGHSRMEGTAKKAGGTLSQVFGTAIPLSMVAAGAAAVVLGKTIVNAAADENEAVNKVNVVFGDSAKSVLAFSDTAASSLGIAKAEALSAAAGFGSMAQSAGIAEGASATMSMRLVTLAADMASFNNQDPSEMLEKLRSGLAGEAEPLRQFGVFISEARVQTEAYKLGIAEAGEELTDAQKIQARYNIILQDTTKQQGDFARTAGESLPNQLRILKASLTDLAADAGQVLLPVMLQLVKVIGAAMENIELLIAAALGFLAWKVLPELFFSIALGLERIGLAAGANAAVGVSKFVGAMGPVAALIGGAVIAGNILNDTFFGTDVSASKAAETIQGQLNQALATGQITVKQYRDAIADANEQGGNFVTVEDQSAQAMRGAAEAAGVATADTEKLTAAEIEQRIATEEATEALREKRLAILGASSSFLGLYASQQDVTEAQRELNRLEQKGKEDTKAYESAVIDATLAQLSMDEAIIDYAKDLDDAGLSQEKIENKIRRVAEQFGVQRGRVDDLIARIRELIRAGNEYDGSNYTATFTTVYDTEGTPGRALQHGGIVTRPTVALVGEAGPEAVIPLNRAGGRLGGIGGHITVNVHGSILTEQEVVDLVRQGLIQAGVRNVTAGIT